MPDYIEDSDDGEDSEELHAYVSDLTRSLAAESIYFSSSTYFRGLLKPKII